MRVDRGRSVGVDRGRREGFNRIREVRVEETLREGKKVRWRKSRKIIHSVGRRITLFFLFPHDT